MPTKRTKRASKKQVVAPLDLRAVNPHGRVDVLAASLIEKFADTRIPELKALIEEKREVIHAALNERLGPHKIPVEWVDRVSPFMPLIIAAGVGIIEQYQQLSLSGKPAPTADKEGVMA